MVENEIFCPECGESMPCDSAAQLLERRDLRTHYFIEHTRDRPKLFWKDFCNEDVHAYHHSRLLGITP